MIEISIVARKIPSISLLSLIKYKLMINATIERLTLRQSSAISIQ